MVISLKKKVLMACFEFIKEIPRYQMTLWTDSQQNISINISAELERHKNACVFAEVEKINDDMTHCTLM
jgi:hypothetical protein